MDAKSDSVSKLFCCIAPPDRVHSCRSMSYREGYLKSDHWRNLRLKKLVVSGTLCHFCRKDSASNDVHHVKYPKNLTDTKLSHLRVLCRRCHNLVHEVLRKYPAINNEESASARWRITEHHVKRALGVKPSFANENHQDEKEERNELSYASKRLRIARVYAMHAYHVSPPKDRTPNSLKFAQWLSRNWNASHEVVLIMAASFARTGFSLRDLHRPARKRQWIRHLRSRSTSMEPFHFRSQLRRAQPEFPAEWIV